MWSNNIQRVKDSKGQRFKGSSRMTETIKIIKLGSQTGNNSPSTTSDTNGQQNNSTDQVVMVPEIARLFTCYHQVYQPPKWVGQQEFQQSIYKYASRAKVYYRSHSITSPPSGLGF